MIRRMLVGVCVVFVCASLVRAAEPKLALVPEFQYTASKDMDGGAVLIFEPSDDVPVWGNTWVFVAIRGFIANRDYWVQFDEGGENGLLTTNQWGSGYFIGSNGGSLDPTWPAENYLRVFDMEAPGQPEVARGIVWEP